MLVNSKHEYCGTLIGRHCRMNFLQWDLDQLALLRGQIRLAIAPKNSGAFQDVSKLLARVPMLGQSRIWRHHNTAHDHFGTFNSLKLCRQEGFKRQLGSS